MQKKIYMDCNSTMRTLPVVMQKVLEVMQIPCNPSSQHFYGQYARKIVEDARVAVKKSVNADESYELIFTSGGTEANNIVMNSWEQCIISAIEHPSILNATKKQHVIPVDKNGLLDLQALEEVLQTVVTNTTTILSIIYANNETGVIQDVKSIAGIAHRYGVALHTDAVQAYGKIAVDVKNLNIDMLTISAHKVGGGVGVGALLFKKNINISPLFFGGNQEKGYRSGTENVAAIAGFGVLSLHIEQSIANMQKVLSLRELFEKKISDALHGVIVCSSDVKRLPNTSSIITPNISNEIQVMYFDMHGIAISAGSACSSGKIEVSHVICAMGFSKILARCAVRVSLGVENSTDDIDFLVSLWKMLCNR